MFGKLTALFGKRKALSASSPVEAVLDKEDSTLEELLDEEEVIQECKALNSRLINFLRDRGQVEKLVQYIVEDPPENADSKRTFKFPLIACEVFTCEIDVILKTLVEEEELMDLLFSFLEPNRQHSALLAGYFSKVLVCLMSRKTLSLMNYMKAHQNVFKQLVDLIGITSIMEVLVRLVGSDDHLYHNSLDMMQWLADSNLLEMIVDKLNSSNVPEVHANAAETLCAITMNAPSPLATKLSSPSFVERVFGHALEDSQSKSALVHSLSVCISLLDPKRSLSSSVMHSFRNQQVYEPSSHAHPDTVGAMLPKLGELLMLLNDSSDEKVLPTSYGDMRPPLGLHRLKIVEFLAVLLKTGNEVAEKELISSGTIRRVLDLFFEYPYKIALHHHVENIICSCLESNNSAIVDHLLIECLQSDKSPTLSSELNLPTMPTSEKQTPRAGYVRHLTRIANKLIWGNTVVQTHLQGNSEWNDWRKTVLHERVMIENVWACGRPAALQDRTRDSDEEDVHDRDYDVAALSNNLSQAFRYNIYDNDDDDAELEDADDHKDGWGPRYDDYFVKEKSVKKREPKHLNESDDDVDNDESHDDDEDDDDDDDSKNKQSLSSHEKELAKLRSQVKETEKANVEPIMQKESLSTHEKELARLHSEAELMEKVNMEPKTWTMQGEVTADKRPKNSALEVDLDFDHNVRPAPVITEEVTASLEEIVSKRILEGRFDDNRKPPALMDKAPRERKELDENKSKHGLGDVYEAEYMKKNTPNEKTDHILRTENPWCPPQARGAQKFAFNPLAPEFRPVLPKKKTTEEVLRNTLFVNNVDSKMDGHTLKRMFAEFGEIEDFRFLGDPHFASRRQAYVQFAEYESAFRATASLNGRVVYSLAMKVRPSFSCIAPVDPMPHSTDLDDSWMGKTVVIKNINKEVDESCFRDFLRKNCGEISPRMRFVSTASHLTNLAFVEFDQAKAAEAAIGLTGLPSCVGTLRVFESVRQVR